ncbi:RNA polymerase sigma factor [Prevotella sp. OH937_COT-195]|uniref:RNA polymerase sigma factor n=1 Tax=Prevotella sp. OH937_COT-195 TaxID=2491051 RepID=UPI000F64D87B|nr:sigma-70 family RNA polymerase sigma factor [Prevotella sp. OH937_COT-195]RRD01877.1 sigma-70 family RNA polymerase sigma factor [Prevotella sp. OH937_COT-195]
MKDLHDMTDEELALSYVDGNNRAFDLLLERTKDRLFQYIQFVVRNKDIAEDIFQETFLKAIAKLNHGLYRPCGKFSGWMMRIAHNAVMDWFREQKSQNIIEPTKGNDLSNLNPKDILYGFAEAEYVNEQVLRDVRRIMDKLPPSQREVVFMRYYQELSFKEIAETTGVSINTALGRMRYAIINMRRIAKENNVVLNMM